MYTSTCGSLASLHVKVIKKGHQACLCWLFVWPKITRQDMTSFFEDLDDDILLSGGLALAIMILILLPNFCFRIPKPKCE